MWMDKRVFQLSGDLLKVGDHVAWAGRQVGELDHHMTRVPFAQCRCKSVLYLFVLFGFSRTGVSVQHNTMIISSATFIVAGIEPDAIQNLLVDIPCGRTDGLRRPFCFVLKFQCS